MTIRIIQGDIFKSDAQVITNPCNCVGVAGAGLSLSFKLKFYDNYRACRKQARAGLLKPGQLMLTKNQTPWILNFPTKDHWRNPSRYEWITAGARKLAAIWDHHEIKSVAMPKLGCGLGGLEWTRVYDILKDTFADDAYDIRVYHID